MQCKKKGIWDRDLGKRFKKRIFIPNFFPKFLSQIPISDPYPKFLSILHLTNLPQNRPPLGASDRRHI